MVTCTTESRHILGDWTTKCGGVATGKEIYRLQSLKSQFGQCYMLSQETTHGFFAVFGWVVGAEEL